MSGDDSNRHGLVMPLDFNTFSPKPGDCLYDHFAESAMASVVVLISSASVLHSVCWKVVWGADMRLPILVWLTLLNFTQWTHANQMFSILGCLRCLVSRTCPVLHVPSLVFCVVVCARVRRNRHRTTKCNITGGVEGVQEISRGGVAAGKIRKDHR